MCREQLLDINHDQLYFVGSHGSKDLMRRAICEPCMLNGISLLLNRAAMV